MTPKERVLAVFEHRPTDRIPIYMGGFSSRVASDILGREAFVGGGIQQYREACALWKGADAHREYLERSQRDAFDLIEVLDLDYVRPAYWRMNRQPTKRLDEHTFLYGNETEVWTVRQFDPVTELYQVIDSGPPRPHADPDMTALERHIEARERTAATHAPTPDSFAVYRAALEYFGDRREVHGGGVGICVPRDDTWLIATALRPDLVRRYLQTQAANAEKNVAVQAAMGLRCLHGGGDFASNQGPFYSPAVFHECVLPALKRVSAACDTHGCFHMFASDGNLWPVATDLFGASGVHAFYEIDRLAGMDLRRLRERFPHLTLLGNIASQTLHTGTVADVVDETMACLEVAHEMGSIMVGCSNQVVAGTPTENVTAMMNTLNANR